MNLGICPNCINQLTEDSALITKPSSIFKGNNVYLMCKNCQQVLLYNRDRDLVFDLDEYKGDEEILEEINRLLSEVDNHYEVAVSAPCQYDCSQCESCDTQFKRASKERKQQPLLSEESVSSKPEEVPDEVIKQTLKQYFLVVNKADPSQKKLLTEQDFSLINIDEWIFFALEHVEIEPVITYKVVRH